jgi:hypothetical protein
MLVEMAQGPYSRSHSDVKKVEAAMTDRETTACSRMLSVCVVAQSSVEASRISRTAQVDSPQPAWLNIIFRCHRQTTFPRRAKDSAKLPETIQSRRVPSELLTRTAGWPRHVVAARNGTSATSKPPKTSTLRLWVAIFSILRGKDCCLLSFVQTVIGVHGRKPRVPLLREDSV